MNPGWIYIWHQPSSEYKLEITSLLLHYILLWVFNFLPFLNAINIAGLLFIINNFYHLNLSHHPLLTWDHLTDLFPFNSSFLLLFIKIDYKKCSAYYESVKGALGTWKLEGGSWWFSKGFRPLTGSRETGSLGLQAIWAKKHSTWPQGLGPLSHSLYYPCYHERRQ